MPKLITTEELINTPIRALTKYEPAILYDLLRQVSEELRLAKQNKEWLEGAIALKYDDLTQVHRMRLGKNTGIIHIDDEGFKITNDIPKKVEWDQKRLTEIIAKILVNGGNPSDYIETIYHIPEAKYNDFAAPIRGMLEPARVIKLGKSSYKLTKLADDTSCPPTDIQIATRAHEINSQIANTDPNLITVIDTFSGGVA